MTSAPLTYATLVHEAARRLAGTGIDTARLDAEVLLRHVTGWNATGLFLRYPDLATSAHAEAFHALIEQRLAGQPVAYLTGTREFMGLAFTVCSHVLVPRPETEILVEWALQRLGSGPVVDIGTGSGAIAVSIAALARRPIDVIATDVSPKALATARINAVALLPPERHSRLTFRDGSLLTPVTGRATLILANLPYLTPSQIAENPDLEAEPRLALDGGPDGLDLVRTLISDLPRVLAPKGAVGLEIDPSQCPAVESLLRATWPTASVSTLPDLAGLPRHVTMTT